MLRNEVGVGRRTTGVLGNSEVTEECPVELYTVHVVAHEVAPAHILAGKLKLALVKDGLLKLLIVTARKGFGLDGIGVAERTLAYFLYSIDGIGCRLAFDFVVSLGKHKEHVGITEVGIVDTGAALRAAAKTSGDPELGPLTVLYSVRVLKTACVLRTFGCVAEKLVDIIATLVILVKHEAIESVETST